jgi:hypothetical protein
MDTPLGLEKEVGVLRGKEKVMTFLNNENI